MKDYAKLDQQWEVFQAAWPVQPMPDEREAKAAFFKLDPSPSTFALMMLGLSIQAASERWSEATFIPLAKNWIARRKWMDDQRGYPPRKGRGQTQRGAESAAGPAGGFSDDARRSAEARKKLGV